jgi:uncharacterized membrane protein
VILSGIRGLGCIGSGSFAPPTRTSALVRSKGFSMIATFGVLQVFFSMLWFFLFIVWIMLLFRVYADIFRSDDMGGFAKAIWIIVCIVFWVLGPMVYIIARGGKMAEREVKAAQDQEAAMKQYIQQAAGSGSVADELHRLSELKDKGVISDAEFQSLKAKALA